MKIKKYVSVQCAEDAIMSINEQNQDRQDRTRSLTLKLKFLPLTFALCMQSNSESVFCTSSPSTTTGLRKDLHLLLPPTPPTFTPTIHFFKQIFFLGGNGQFGSRIHEDQLDNSKKITPLFGSWESQKPKKLTI